MVEFAACAVSAIRWTRRDVGDFLGRYLSTPKPDVVFAPAARPARRMAAARVRLDPKTQLLYLGARFYMNGEAVRIARGDAAALRELADRRTLAGSRLRAAASRALILQWQRCGFVHLDAPR
jgi:50S ribosomal protein L16 3-hydroxylase